MDAVSGSKMCFAPGTLVLTPSGPAAIESIMPGDLVVSHNPESGETGPQRVLNRIITQPAEFLTLEYIDVDGEVSRLLVTREHPFYVDHAPTAHPARGPPAPDSQRSFVPAELLRSGDRLVLRSGLTARVKSLGVLAPRHAGALTAYNIEVENWNTYFVCADRDQAGADATGANGVLVHNTGIDCTVVKDQILRIMASDGVGELEALKRFVKQHNDIEAREKIDLLVPSMVDDIMKRSFQDTAAALRAIPPDAPDYTEAVRTALKKVPSIAESEAFAASPRKPGESKSWLEKLNYQNHHVDPKYVIRALINKNYPNWSDHERQAEFERIEPTCPAYLMHRLRHTGRDELVEKTIHRILSSDDPEGVEMSPGRIASLTVEQIRDRLSRAYVIWKEPEVGEVAEAWLRSEGLIP